MSKWKYGKDLFSFGFLYYPSILDLSSLITLNTLFRLFF